MNLLDTLKKHVRSDGAVITVLVLAAALTYALCLPNEMFWDDQDFILKNAYIKDWQYWTRYFTENVIAGNHLLSNYWRPLLQVVFAGAWHLWSDWVWGWHAVSIACHAGAGILLWRMLEALTGQRALAVLTALVWTVHPVHSESVVYPNSLGDALSAVFVFAGVLLYARFRRSPASAPRSARWWSALLMYPLALLSKETGILLVAFIALADFFYLSPPGTFVARVRRVLAALWPFIVIAAGYLILRATILNFNNSFNFYNEATPFTTHVDTRLWTFFKVISLYAGFIFIPYDLQVERLITPPASFFTWDVIWGAALCALLAALAARNWTRRPTVAFGVLWFFTGILPTSNLMVIINALVYEHFLYTALAGILLITLTFALEWAHDERRRRILVAVVLVWTLVLAGRTAWRCLDWRTTVGFYEQLLPRAPRSYRVINNLGMAYAESGRTDQAEATYKKAIALDPKNAVAYHNLANIYRDNGRPELARLNYEKAIALQRNFIFSYKSLAQIYLNSHEYAKARRILEDFYQMTEERVSTLNLLTEIASREGAWEDAKRYQRTLLDLRPHDPAVQETLRKLEEMTAQHR